MNKFEAMLSGALEEDEEVQSTFTASTGNPALLMHETMFSENKYRCLEHQCENEGCDAPVLYVIDPIGYDLTIGDGDNNPAGIPLELYFCLYEGEIVEDTVEIWSDYSKASKDVWQCVCDSCGHENKIVLTEDRMLVVHTRFDEKVDRSIPINRIQYVEKPKDGWTVQDPS